MFLTATLIFVKAGHGAAQPASALPASSAAAAVPTFKVTGYHLAGNTVLPPEKLDFLTNYTGPAVGGARVIEGLGELQLLYQSLGFPAISVTLPKQNLTNGIVEVKVFEGGLGGRLGAAQPANLVSATNPAPAAEVTFKVAGYHVSGNTVLSPGKLDFLTNYTGPAVSFSRVREGLGELQLLYRNLGFATINVALPKQSLSNNIVEVQVFEGKLESINIVSNRFFSSNNILGALPSLTTNILINTKWLQPELDRANLNPDRQIYPVISPGLESGTTDLTLDVKDRFPIHGHIEVNDKSTPLTPLLRIDTALQYNNLWQLNHQIGVEYNLSPQRTKPDNYPLPLYDQPMVDSYSAFYRMPLGAGPGLRGDFERLPVDFGYDQITHRFNLPPPSGSPELIFYASRSASDTLLRYSPLTTVVSSPLVQITSQSSSQILIITENIGVKYNMPLGEFAGVRSSLAVGADYKDFRARGFNTNIYSYTTINTNSATITTNQSTTPLASNTRQDLAYAPFSLGWSGDRPDKWGSWSFNLGQNFYLAPLASARTNFQSVAGSSAAGGNYASFSAGVTREERLPGNWSLLARSSAHWATAPLISNEQFPLGGTAGVRGYQEGENYSDAGWRVTTDLRAPPYGVGAFPLAAGPVPAFVRPSVFMDYGEGWQLDRKNAVTDRQWGTGFGVFLTAGLHFESRLTLGWALQRTPTTSVGGIQAYVSMGTQF
jgi:hemolysin activation/secretion protein